MLKKNAYALKTPHVVALQFIYGVECIQFHTLLTTLKNVSWPSDLDLWPMTLTFELVLDILPLDLHTEIQVCMSVRLAVRVVTHRHTDTHTDTQTHRRCQNYYNRHVTYVTWGVMIRHWICICEVQILSFSEMWHKPDYIKLRRTPSTLKPNLGVFWDPGQLIHIQWTAFF